MSSRQPLRSFPTLKFHCLTQLKTITLQLNSFKSTHPLTLIKEKGDEGINEHGNSPRHQRWIIQSSSGRMSTSSWDAYWKLSEILVVHFQRQLTETLHTQLDAIQLSSWRTYPANPCPIELSIHLKIMALFQPPPGDTTTVPGFISKSYSITRVEERMMSTTRQRFLLSGVAREECLG